MPEGVFLSPFPVLETPASFPTFSDGYGGVWSVYLGAHPGSALYASHINGDGSYAPGFSVLPRALTLPGTQVNGISAASDGLDGAVTRWFGVNPADSTSPFLALRFLHIGGDGEIPFGFRDTGVVVSNIASAAMIVGDNVGGAYVVWEELKGASNPEIFAQRYDPYGNPLWTPSGSPTGRPVCAVVGIQRLRALHSDGMGGAYVIWADQRSVTNAPLYVAHLNLGGVDGAPWTPNGIPITPVTAGIRIVGSRASPDGGLWVAWRDLAVADRVWGQKVAVNGGLRWSPIAPMIAMVTPLRADFVPAPSGAVFLTWGGADLRCSKMDSTGVRVWASDPLGRVMVTPTDGAFNSRAFKDGVGGQWLAWSQDVAGQRDVHYLRVDGAAAPYPDQPPEGEPFAATAANEDPVGWFPPWANGQPLLSWLDAGVLRIRSVPTSSPLGVEPGAHGLDLSLGLPAPHPPRASTAHVRFTAPAGECRLEIFDLTGRRVAERELWSSGGPQSGALDGAASLPSGVYSLRLTADTRAVTRRIVRL